eukprot:917237-Amphidinium_carterae.1
MQVDGVQYGVPVQPATPNIIGGLLGRFLDAVKQENAESSLIHWPEATGPPYRDAFGEQTP